MGLLTNPKNRSKISKFISNNANNLSFLMFIGGVAWFVSLVHPYQNGGTYFSENALLPGMVDSSFNSARDAESYYEGYKSELNSVKSESDVPLRWLKEQLISLGLEVYTQKYNFTYPMNLIQNQTATGENLYAILRAPRASSAESVVMTAPLRPKGSGLKATDGSIGIMLAMAKHMRRYTYWSKDIIFLFTQHEFVGMQAWLDGYHLTKASEHITAESLAARGGAIQAAVNIELEKNQFSGINLKIEGANGVLPNLDLVNVVAKLCRMESVTPMIHRRSDLRTSDHQQLVEHNLVTMFLMMAQQATGMPSGNHGLFLRYRIEALTIEAMPGSQHKFSRIGVIIEGVFRSINNLLERFHQSFFFYLLPSTTRYVSIGVYIPPFALIASAGLIQTIALWTQFSQAVITRDSKIRAEGKEKAFTADGKLSLHAVGLLRLPNTIVQGLLRVMPIFIGCELSGFILYKAPSFFGNGELKQLPAVDAVILGSIALLISSMLITRAVARKEEFDDMNWELFKVMALIVHGLSLFAFGLLNISMAMLIAVFTVPVYCLVKPVTSKILTMLQAILLLLVSPVAIFTIIRLLHSILIKEKLVYQGWSIIVQELETSLVYGLIDHSVFGNWLFTAVTLVITPNWLMMWTVIWMCV